jgi:hypothetical protein
MTKKLLKKKEDVKIKLSSRESKFQELVERQVSLN